MTSLNPWRDGRLPPAPVLLALERFGFRRSDVARRFYVTTSAVSVALKKLGRPDARRYSGRR